MAKSHSPVRLDQSLMQAAKLAGSTLHRSTVEQVEYWADLGRKVAPQLDPKVLLEVQSGLLEIKVESVKSAPLNPDDVFRALAQGDRKETMQQAIQGGAVRYQASDAQPGLLEKIAPDGGVVVGQFINGEFIESGRNR